MLPDEKLEGLRQSIQKYSKEAVTTEDARNLLRFIELLIETDKKVGMSKTNFSPQDKGSCSRPIRGADRGSN